MTTNSSGSTTGTHGYYAYRKGRDGSEVGTENRFTAPKGPPKRDGTGLQYFNARYGW